MIAISYKNIYFDSNNGHQEITLDYLQIQLIGNGTATTRF